MVRGGEAHQEVKGRESAWWLETEERKIGCGETNEEGQKEKRKKSIKSKFARQISISLITGIRRRNQKEEHKQAAEHGACANYRKEKGLKENGEASQVGSVGFAWVQEASCVAFAASLAQPLCYRVRGVVNAAWDLRKTVPKHTRWQFTHGVLRLRAGCRVCRDNHVMFSRSVTLSSVLLFLV